MPFSIDPNAQPLIQTTMQPYGAPPDASQDGVPVVAGRGGSVHIMGGGGSPYTKPTTGKAGKNGYGYGANEMPPLGDYFRSRALTDDPKEPKNLASVDEATFANWANDYANHFIPASLEGAYQRKADKGEVDAHVARFNMKFANDLPKWRQHFIDEANKSGAPVAAVGAPGLVSALGTHALGTAEQGASQFAAGAPGVLANEMLGADSSGIIGAGADVLNAMGVSGPKNALTATKENIRQAINPLMAPAVSGFKKAGEEDLAANADVLKEHPYLTKGSEIAGGVAPYALSSVVGPAGPVSIGMAQMGGERLLAEQQRIASMKQEDLDKLPEYTKLLQATGGNHDKAKELLAKASSEAAERVGELGGGLMGLIGGGGMTKPIQMMIAKAVAGSTFKRVLATAAAEGAGFGGQQIASNLATTAATNKATGGNEKADVLGGADQQGLLGVAMGTIGALLHGKGKLGATPKPGAPEAKPEAKPGTVGKPGETPPPVVGAAPEGMKPDQAKAYSEASTATLANPEYHVKPGESEETAQAALIPALEDFEGKLNASDTAFTPEEKTAALSQFEQDWRTKFGVKEAAPVVQETAAPSAAEAATAVGEEAPVSEKEKALAELDKFQKDNKIGDGAAIVSGSPVGDAFTRILKRARDAGATEDEIDAVGKTPVEAPVPKAGDIAEQVEPVTDASNKEVHPIPEPVPVRDLVTQKGVDTRIPLGVTEQVAQDLRTTLGREPLPHEINDHANLILDTALRQNGIDRLIPRIALREAVGKLIEENPKEHPDAHDINEKAKEMLKSGEHDKSIAERVKAFEKADPVAQARIKAEKDQKFRDVLKKTDQLIVEQKAQAAKDKTRADFRKGLSEIEKQKADRAAKEEAALKADIEAAKKRQADYAARAAEEKKKEDFRDVLRKTNPKAEAEQGREAGQMLRKAGEKDEFGNAVTGRAAHEVRAEIISGVLGKIKGIGKEVFKALTRMGKLEVVQSMDRLPQEAIDAFNKHPEAGPIKGYYEPSTGKSYLVADHLTEGEAVPTILHEVGAHYGLKRMLLPSMYRALEKYVEDTRHMDTPDGRELAKAYADAQEAKVDPRNAINETMATMITNRGGEKGTIWARAMAGLRAFLFNKIGKFLPDKLVNKLINNDTLIELARGSVIKISREELATKLRATDEPWIDHPGQFSRAPLKDVSKAEGKVKAQPTTIDDLERAWKVRPAQTEVAPEKKAFEQTAFQKATTAIANVLKPLMHYNESLIKAGATIDPKADMYNAFVRLGGQKKHIVDTDYHEVIEPVENKAAELMAQHGVAPEKFWDSVIRYIGAKHALEDNRRGELENVRLTDEAEAQRAPLKLQLHEGKLDPKEYMVKLKAIVNAPGARIEKNVPPLSGVPNVLAHEAVARAGKDVPVEALEAMNEALNPAREKHIQNGLTNKTYTPNDVALLRAYNSKYYLPNTGFADENILPSGGARPLGAFTKEAGYQAGRTTLGANPLDNFIRALRRSGEDIANNQATKTAYNAAIAKGNTLGARVKTYNVESLVRDALAGGGRLSDVQKIFKDPNSVVHNDGKFRHVITYPENSPVLEAMKKSQEPPDVGAISKNVGRATSLLARLYAGLNPTFAVVTSLARDSTAYPTMLLADGKFAAAARYTKNYAGFGGPFGAWKTFLGGKSIFNKSLGEIQDYAKANPDSFAGWYIKLSEQGGAFNFKDELQEVRKSQDLLDKLTHESRNLLDPREYWAHFKQFQDSIATGSLMIGRTSVFKSLVEGGMSEAKAAQYVKELTNFQQRSGITDVLNHWFAFSRVGMASADRIAQFMKNEDGSFNYKKAGGLVALGTAYGALSYQLLINQMGEDKAKKLTNDSLSRNFIIPNGTDKPIQLPMGLGLPRLMFGLGMMATRWAHGHTTTKEAAESYKNTVMENLSPLHPIQPEAGASASTQAGDLLTAMIPTVARPVAEVALNQSAFGTPITREQTNGRFKSDSGKATTPQFWVDMAKGLHSIGGPDMFPESLQYMTNAYGGGALGMFLRSMKADRLEELGQKPTTLERYLPQLENRDIEFSSSKDFYQQKDRLQDATKQAAALKAEGKPIPATLQRSLDEEKKLNAASHQHSKELKAVNDNRLLSPAAKATQLTAINERFKRVQEQLSKEASRIGVQ